MQVVLWELLTESKKKNNYKKKSMTKYYVVFSAPYNENDDILSKIQKELSNKKTIRYDGAGYELDKKKVTEKSIYYFVQDKYNNLEKMKELQKKYNVKISMTEIKK